VMWLGPRKTRRALTGGSVVWDINHRGEMAGYGRDAEGLIVPMVWNADGVGRPLSGRPYGGIAYGLNNRGMVVGSAGDPNDGGVAAAWDRNSFARLGRQISDASDVNESEFVVGSQSFSLPGMSVHPWLWAPAGGSLDLGTLAGPSAPDPSFDFGFADAINDRHQVVGASVTALGDLHATLWLVKRADNDAHISVPSAVEGKRVIVRDLASVHTSQEWIRAAVRAPCTRANVAARPRAATLRCMTEE
jgi:uncharacterized membrane protein